MRLSRPKILILAIFLAIPSVFAMLDYGYIGFFPAALANSASKQVFCDLIVSLSLVCTWLVRDARKRGISVMPYVVVTVLFGSFGPLLYLLREDALPQRA
ncbi:MAG: DUF2834 domain-containing protein [Candidatus Eremiobacteraeota bacterium]|nr:DUF2834 domain-containing protein [Candidatus Eremiobacteraeota bacterium]